LDYDRGQPIRPDPLGVSLVEFLANRAEMSLLELAHREAAPAIGRADVHELYRGAGDIERRERFRQGREAEARVRAVDLG
jgi:hypothetical protein